MSLKPIKLLPIRESVVSILRKAILSQEFAEGEELTLDGVSRLLGVSVTPFCPGSISITRSGWPSQIATEQSCGCAGYQ